MKKETVITIVESLAAESPRRFSEKEIALKIRNWMTKLADLTDKQGVYGLEKALDIEGGFMPSIGDFKRMCLAGDGCNSLEDEARVAWALVIFNLNHSISPVFKDSAIAETIRKIGGWKKLCGMLSEEEPFRRRDFLELYPVYRRKKEQYFPQLTGTFPEQKFIGFKSQVEIEEIKPQIESAKKDESKLLAIMARASQDQKMTAQASQ